MPLCRYTWADAQMYDIRLPQHLDGQMGDQNTSAAAGQEEKHGHALGHPDRFTYVLYLWCPVCLLMANDIRKMKQFNRLLEWPPQKSFHFFICKHAWPNGLLFHA